MQVAILAGGLGTRLRPLTNKIPKPMVLVNGKPFLEHELRMLKSKGFDDFLLCVGYLGNAIENYFGSGEKLGAKISYSYDGESLKGPAGALKNAEPLLKEIFFVTYADAFLELDYRRILERFSSSNTLGLMVVFENHNRFGKSDLAVKNGLVTKYNKTMQTPDMVWINYGVSLLRKKAMDLIPKKGQVGEEEFYAKLIREKELLAYETKERFYEIGTPESLGEFEKYLARK
jgi:N-acetyl-alpha-D-muramate 1-phosphate uridylyltransferase